MFDSARIKYFAYIEAVNISKESEENHHTTKIHQMLAHFGCVISNSSIYKFVTFHFALKLSALHILGNNMIYSLRLFAFHFLCFIPSYAYSICTILYCRF